MNPRGVVFGPNAALDVKGSFAVTTADAIKLGDGGTFRAQRARGERAHRRCSGRVRLSGG